MKKTRNNTTKITMAILAILLVSSIAMIANLANNTASAQDYGDIMQYEWPLAQSDEGHTGANAGPGPDRPNIKWSVSTRASGMVSIMNGKALAMRGTTLYAYDAFTGEELYAVEAENSPSPNTRNAIYKIDDTYLLTQGTSGITCRFIETGEVAWNLTIPNAFTHPGSAAYFGGRYSTSMKQFICTGFNTETIEALILGYDLSDPSQIPPLAWTYVADASCEILCCGDGKVFLGTTEGAVDAIDSNGTRVWHSALLGGIAQQAAIYYNHNLYVSATTWQLTCFEGETGEMLWRTEKGIRAFSAYHGTAGDGMIFESTVELDPYGTVGAWDAETGERLWKQPAYFNIHYATMAYADGKVYGITCDQSAGIRTGGLAMPGYEFACFDAYTGTQLWKLPGNRFTTPSIAYGNLYGISDGLLYCIGGDPEDWNFGLIGNTEDERVAVGQQGPADISTAKWEFQTGGDVFSSPAVVDGKVYFGSEDKNWYCLDAYTGEKLWNFTTGFFVRASAAVVGGKVFTGADDGYFYCLDADTGEELWKTSAGGFFPQYLSSGEGEPRSSPIVVGGRLYCGSLDGKVYCLSTSDGDVLHTYETDGPIMGSPAYSDGTIYIASTDSYLYALDETDLSFKWSSFGLDMDIQPQDSNILYATGTPVIADGTVVIGGGIFRGQTKDGVDYINDLNMSVPSGGGGGGIRMFAFDAETGESIWNQSRTGNTQPFFVPVYWDGEIIAPEFFEVTAMDLDDPFGGDYTPADYTTRNRVITNRTRAAWLGYQIQSSVAYADDLTGDKIYVGCDIGSVYCLDPEDMSTYSVFTCGGNVPCSPAIWDGKMYIGATTGKLYCFDDSPIVDMSLWADTNKGGTMWNNETLEICGRLTSNPMEQVFVPTFDEEGEYVDGAYVYEESLYHPGIPNATIELYLTKPDGTDETLTTTTGKDGSFAFSVSPTDVGDWGWVVNYNGEIKPSITYSEAYGDWNAFSVTSPITSEPEPPPGGGIPVEYVYVAVAVIVIVLAALGIYFFMKSRK